MNPELFEKIKNADIGAVKLGRKQLFTYYKMFETTVDDDGNIIDNNYLCSKILNIVKVSDTEISISMINLKKDYDGAKIDVYNPDVEWEYVATNIAKILSLDIKNSWKDFVKAE